MKNSLVIIVTFLTCFMTSMLLDWSFINQNPVRYTLVVLMVICELMVGFNYLRVLLGNDDANENRDNE